MKILVIDHAGLVADCLADVDAEITCQSDEIQALNIAEQLRPELIFLNFGLRGESTPDYIRLLVNVAPAASLIVVGEQTSEECVLRCLLSGAKGFQVVRTLPEYCVRLVQAINRGEAWVSRKLVASLLDTVRQLVLENSYLKMH